MFVNSYNESVNTFQDLKELGGLVRLLITTNGEAAKKFIKHSHSRRTQQFCPFDVSYASLTSQEKTSLFLNPLDQVNYKKFIDFSYSIGFSESADSKGLGDNNFLIQLRLHDFDNKFDEEFMTAVFDFELLKKNYQDFVSNYKKLKENVKKPDINVDFEETQSRINEIQRKAFLEDFNDSSDRDLKIFKQGIGVSRTFYFVIINDIGEYVGPIVSEFVSSEIIQEGPAKVPSIMGSLRKVNLKFICTGNPNIQSKLSNLKYYDSASISQSPERNNFHKTISIKRNNIDLIELDKNPKLLDEFVKSILYDLFKDITKRDVLLLLPDFVKIYEDYKNSPSLDLLVPGFNSLYNSYIGQFVGFEILKGTIVKSFLNHLGFEILDTGGIPTFNSFIPGLPPEEKEKLRQLADSIYRLKDETEKSFNSFDLVDKWYSNLTDRGISTDGSFPSFNLETNFIGQSKNGNDQLLFESLTELQGVVAKQRLATLSGPSSKTKQQVKQNLLDILDRLYFSRLLEIARKTNNTTLEGVLTGAVKSSQNPAEKAPNQITAAMLNISLANITFNIKSSDELQSGLAKKTGEIDFNEFLNNFTNKLNKACENGKFNQFNLQFGEENNLLRLENIKNCISFKGKPVVSNIPDSLILIYDQYFFECYYSCLNGITAKDNFYPISKEDSIDNFGVESKFFKNLVQLKNSDAFSTNGITIPFVKNKSYFSSNPTDQTPFSIAQDFLNSKDPKKFDNYRNKLPHPVNLFIYNPNKTKKSQDSSIIEFKAEADTLNYFAAFNYSVQNLESIVLDEYFREIKLDGTRRLLGDKANKIEELYRQYFIKGQDDEIMKEIDTILTESVGQDLGVKDFESNLNKTNSLTPGYYSQADTIKANEALQNFYTANSLLAKYFGSEDLQTSIATLQRNASTNEAERRQLAKGIYQKLPEIKKKAINQIKTVLYDVTFAGVKEDGQVTKVLTTVYSDPIMRTAELYRQIYSKVYTFTIKTFPKLQINSISNINAPAIVLIYNYQRQNLTYDSDEKPIYRQISPMSGYFRIIGFRHTITNDSFESGGTNATSEFMLTKDPMLGGF